MENQHFLIFLIGKTHYQWPFSIAMLVYQRVTNNSQFQTLTGDHPQRVLRPTTSTARRFTRCWMASRRSAAPMDDRAAASSPMELGPC